VNNSATSHGNGSTPPTVQWRHPATDVRSHKWPWSVLPNAPVRLAWRLLRFWCALLSEARSFLGHIQTRLARKHSGLDLGREFQRSADGHLLGNEWTKARSLGMQALVSVYSWASTTDLQIFLEGVHVGEQSALGILGFGSDKQVLANVGVEPSPVLSRIGNSMPPQAVQQTTKCDLLAPLPSPDSASENVIET
jgi:hypothetical protein